MISSNRMKSGFEVQRWVERWVVMMLIEGRIDGPACCDINGFLFRSIAVNDEFRRQLSIIHKSRGDLIKDSIGIDERYNIHQYLRQGSISAARAEGVKPDIIDLINRCSNSHFQAL